MNNIERMKVGVGVGLGAAALLFTGIETQHHWDPAEAQQQQVEACAPDLAFQAEPNSPTVPKACETFGYDLGRFNGTTFVYDLPARHEFIGRFTPGNDYNQQKLVKYAEVSLALGAVIGLGPIVISLMLEPFDKNPKPVEPEPSETMSVRVYRRRHAQRANDFPLDNLSNGDLRMYAAQVRERQQRPPID